MSAAVAKRLRFPYHPAADESAIGAFVEACHAQRLRAVASGLEGAGTPLSRPGLLQIAPEGTLALAGAAMRIDGAELGRRAFAATGRRERVALGDLVMPRSAFELERRRVAPIALLAKPHHRAAWLNLLLPYCPETLEALVDACPECGPLGWRQARGVANCDACGKVVPPAATPGLDRGLADAYRLAADLMSRDPEIGRAAARRLSPMVRGAPRTALVGVALRAGMVLGRDMPECDRSVRKIADLAAAPAEDVAATLCDGVRLLSDWPQAAKDEADRRIAAIGDDLAAYERLLRDLRWIGSAGDAAGRALADMAFPVLDGRNSGTLASGTRFYPAAQTNALLWTSSAELGRLRDARAIKVEKMPSGRRFRGRYEADDVDELRAQLHGGVSPGAAASELDAPTYAIGQFVAADLLATQDHPGVEVLRGGLVSAASIAKLKRLLAAEHSAKPPAGAVALRTALLRHPGEKPWAEAVQAMIYLDLPFHLPDPAAVAIRQILVAPEAVGALPPPATPDVDALGQSLVPLRDVCEMMCCDHLELVNALASAKMASGRSGRQQGVARGDLRRLAQEIAFTGEVAARTGSRSVATFHLLRRSGVTRTHGAWSRPDLVRRGLAEPLATREES